MWSDTILNAERVFILRILVWGGLSMLAGTALLLATILAPRMRGGLLRAFGAVCAIAGALELAIAGVGYATMGLRDVGGAARLERMAWLELGLWFGLAALGVTLAIAGWRLSRSVRAVGSGLAITMHALALTFIDLQLISVITR